MCEATIDVADVCEDCLRLAYGTVDKPKRTVIRADAPPKGRRIRLQHFDPSPCQRGHFMVWKVNRWRCPECDAMYVRKRKQRLREVQP